MKPSKYAIQCIKLYTRAETINNNVMSKGAKFFNTILKTTVRITFITMWCICSFVYVPHNIFPWSIHQSDEKNKNKKKIKMKKKQQKHHHHHHRLNRKRQKRWGICLNILSKLINSLRLCQIGLPVVDTFALRSRDNRRQTYVEIVNFHGIHQYYLVFRYINVKIKVKFIFHS